MTISNDCLVQVLRVDNQKPRYGQRFYNNGNLNNIPEGTSMIFSKTFLKFYPLEPYKDLLDDERMKLLIDFAEEVRENNEALVFFKGTLSFNRFNNKLSKICENYYQIFKFFGFDEPGWLDSLQPNDKQMIKNDIGILHDYRSALNHNPMNKKGWLFPKGTKLKDIPITQQEAIDETCKMLEFAIKQASIANS